MLLNLVSITNFGVSGDIAAEMAYIFLPYMTHLI
jgi:hypothetical protein